MTSNCPNDHFEKFPSFYFKIIRLFMAVVLITLFLLASRKMLIILHYRSRESEFAESPTFLRLACLATHNKFHRDRINTAEVTAKKKYVVTLPKA